MLRGYHVNLDPFFGLLLISAGNGLQVVLLGTRAPKLDSAISQQVL